MWSEYVMYHNSHRKGENIQRIQKILNFEG